MKSTQKEKNGKAIVALLASIEAVVDKQIEKRAARLARPRWVRCSKDTVTHRQRIEDVAIVKIGKYFYFDSWALDELASKKLAETASTAAANDAGDGDEAIDDVVRALKGGAR